MGLVGETVVATMRVRLVGRVGVISRVAVRQDFRGRRIGSMLVEYAENIMAHRNASVIEVEIYGAVETQVDFYKRLGYEETGRLERLGEEIVVMQKSLVESDLEIED